MKPVERYEKYNGAKIAADINAFCKVNPEKYKHGCYYCPLYGWCNSENIKSIDEITDMLMCKGTEGPVSWEKHIDSFYENNKKSAYEIDLERREHLYPKSGWR